MLLTGMQSAAVPHLQRALAILLDGAAFGTAPDSSEDVPDGPPRLSARMIDLLVEQRLHDISAQESVRHKPDRAASEASCNAARQRAVVHMLEAMALLDEIDETTAVPAIQQALDRVLGPGSRELAPGEDHAARRHPS